MEQDARKQEKEQEARGKMQEQAIAGSKKRIKHPCYTQSIVLILWSSI